MNDTIVKRDIYVRLSIEWYEYFLYRVHRIMTSSKFPRFETASFSAMFPLSRGSGGMEALSQTSLWAAALAVLATFALGRIVYALSTVGRPRPRHSVSKAAKAMIVLGSGDSCAVRHTHATLINVNPPSRMLFS